MSSKKDKIYSMHPGWELKRSCPKNMGISGVIVNGTFLLIVLLILILQDKISDKITIQSDVVSVSNIDEAGGNGISPTERPVSTNSKGSMAMLLPDDFPSGFMPNIKIIRDYPLPTVTISISVPSDVYESISLNPSFSEVNPDPYDEENNTFAYGTGDNYGDDYGMPLQKPYMPNIRIPVRLISNIVMPTKNSAKKGLIVLYPILFPSYASKNDTGYVDIIINLDKKGRIEWEIIKEEPKGKGFGIAVVEALKRSKFNPPLNEYGEKTSIRLN